MGDGPDDMVYVPTWLQHVEVIWEYPAVRRFFERLARFSRLILFDRRGTGLSDPLRDQSTLELEDQMDDVLAVMEAAGSDRASLFAQLEGGAMAALFAASYPERTTSLLLYAAWARSVRAPDYPAGNTREQRRALAEGLVAQWGTGERARLLAPSLADDPEYIAWFGKLERSAASPGTVEWLMRESGEIDVRNVLSTIQAPTLVVHRRDDPVIDIGHSRYLAEHIPGARFLELPGSDSLAPIGEPEAMLDALEEMITGAPPHREPDRVLATVLFTDICRSTERAAELGDRRWRDVLARHDELVRREIDRQRGRAVKSIGDGFLATFDGPARAIACARGVVEGAQRLGLEIRAGLHTGEVEVIGDDVGGMAVHIGSRVSTLAGAGEVLVSGTVKDLVVGSGIEFEERGTRELRGVPGEWRLYAAGPAG